MFENQNENWRAIPNYPDYLISDQGRLYSKIKDKMIRPDSHGGVTLYNPQGHKGWSVQVIMSCTFLGNDIDDPCRNRTLFKDGNSSNLLLENLYVEDTSDLPGEEWSSIKYAAGRELQSFYQVSNLGRVKSLKHYVEVNNHSKVIQKPCPELIISCVKEADGYMFAYLACKDGTSVNAQVHCLVAAAFCPNDDPEHKDVVNHIDGNPSNNCAENLEWCTAAENAQHALRTGLRGNWKGRRLRYGVLRLETNQFYPSLTATEDAMGRGHGYITEQMKNGYALTDKDGNVWTLDIHKGMSQRIHTEGQHCTIDEFPGKEFISLGQASLAIGRWEGYISDALKRGGVIRNKAGQLMHVHLVGEAPVVSANVAYAEKKAAGLVKPKKERIKSKWKPRKAVKCIETGEIYASCSAADRAIGQRVGYLSECFSFNRSCFDSTGNKLTFEFVDANIKIPYKKNPCYFVENPEQIFANFTEASEWLGREGSYISGRLKENKPILDQSGKEYQIVCTN